MRFDQALLGIVGLLAIGGASACGPVAAAKAVDAVNVSGVSVEVSPSQVAAGSRVAVRANCTDSSDTATITSPILGTLTAQRPNTSSTLLVVEVDIPGVAAPGTFEVTMTCRSGATASTRLTIVGAGPADKPTVGPHTGGGFLAGREDSDRATPWLASSAAALTLSAALAAASVRRRRRTLASRADH
jgi:hypothetical protein